MKVIYGISSVKKSFKNIVLAIGVFDGVHIGHQALIKKSLAKAKEINGQVMVMTFDPHPAHVLRPDKKMPLIMSLEHRLQLFEELGVAYCLVVKFTKKFSQIPPERFIKRYIVNTIKPKEIFVGAEFCFGKNRNGTIDFLKDTCAKNGIKVNSLLPIQGEKGKVGSSYIRKLIALGNLLKVKKFLGRPASIMGKVVKGDQRGINLGFPTANIFPKDQVIPPLGVYAVQVKISNKIFQGMANVGIRPSFKNTNKRVNIETHIFNFHKKLYDKVIIIKFVKKIRDEKIFPTLDNLTAQLKRDQVKALKVLS